ncbi:metal ABC transporter permease [Devriesea agamarum]|uniref:metal ABC transporter permease n=1 Tax=Devriesea agamarum TaxID=472569 RepID=UPI00071C6B64|nr:metal ABC transporter permease [Devriesea agamarum]
MLHSILNFDGFTTLVPVVWESLIAGAVLGIAAGLIGPMIQARDLAFAVHGVSELSFAGAGSALFLGVSVTWGSIIGSVVAALLLAFMGVRARQRNSVIGILLPFGMGLGLLFLSLYKGRTSNKFGLLTGQIVSVDQQSLDALCAITLGIAIVLILVGRPMWFAAIDPVFARTRGVHTRALGVLFMLMLGLVCAMAVQMVGALLVMSLLITPAAAAARVSARPGLQWLLSVVFAVVSAVGGILLSLGPGLPISPYVTSVSFAIYLVCWGIGAVRSRGGWGRRGLASKVSVTALHAPTQLG